MRFPLSYWFGPPLEEMTPERYREIADCGFTIAAPPPGSSMGVNLQHLDLCHEAGITGLVGDHRLVRERNAIALDHCPGWQQEAARAVQDYRDHPALYGYYIGDEPHRQDFADLAQMCHLVHRLDPTHSAYINLYPTYAAPHLPGSAHDQLGTATYEEHVATFQRMIRPHLLSYDHYALFDDGSLRPEYFENLAIIRRQALAAHIPFWQTILLTPHFRYRDPDEADLRWQAYTTLAYGRRGLAYFTYWTPVHANYRNAIIDPFGARTSHYACVRRINRELQALGPTLLALSSQRVVHAHDVPPDTQGIVRGIAGGSCVVGEFGGADGTPYVLIVNNDRAHAAQLRVEVSRGTEVLEVSRRTGAVSPLQEEGRSRDGALEIWLAPGDGRLFRVEAVQT